MSNHKPREQASEYLQKWIFAGISVLITLIGYQSVTLTNAMIEIKLNRNDIDHIAKDVSELKVAIKNNNNRTPYPDQDVQPPREALPKEDRRNGLRPE